MSDQQETGAVTSLEEVFLSREFGRSPSRGISSIGQAHEVAEPPELEQVFLSEEFGHPEAITAATPGVRRPRRPWWLAGTGPSATARGIGPSRP